MKVPTGCILALSLAASFAHIEAQTFVHRLSFGTEGSADGQFDGIEDLAVHPSQDKVYILDNPSVGDTRIHLFTKSGAFVKTVEYSNADNYGNQNLESIAVGPDGNVYVNDRTNFDLLKYNDQLVFQRFVLREADMHDFTPTKNHNSLAVDTLGNYYFHVYWEDGFVKYSADGTYVGKVVNVTYNAPYVPICIDRTTNDIYTVGRSSGGIVICDDRGRVIKRIGSQGIADSNFVRPEGIAVAPNKDIIVVECGAPDTYRMQHFDSSGTFLGFIGGKGSADGQFDLPRDVDFDPVSGNLFVSDAGNARIQVFGRAAGATNDHQARSSAAARPASHYRGSRTVRFDSRLGLTRVAVTDGAGRLAKAVHGNRIEVLDVSRLRRGVYVLSLENEQRCVARKLFVQ
jgi:hypothetical protein